MTSVQDHAPPIMSSPKINILYIEDDPEDRTIFWQFLSGLDPDAYYVETVSGVEGAMFSLQLRVFDVLFVDLILETTRAEGESQAFIRQLRAAGNRIPIVVTTGASPNLLDDSTRKMVDDGSVLFFPKDDWTGPAIAKLVRRAIDGPLRVLYIDDDDEDCAYVRHTLRKDTEPYEFEVVTVQSSAEARELSENQVFDAYLIDLKLNHADGIDLAREIIKSQDNPSILIVSGIPEAALQKRGLSASGKRNVGFLSKDQWDRERLVRAILCQRNCLTEHHVSGMTGFEL